MWIPTLPPLIQRQGEAVSRFFGILRQLAIAFGGALVGGALVTAMSMHLQGGPLTPQTAQASIVDVTVVTNSATTNGGSPHNISATATCPSGKLAIGGGGSIAMFNPDLTGASLADSRPVGSNAWL